MMENEITLAQANEIASHNIDMYCSMKSDTQMDKVKLFAAVSNSESLDDHIGEVFGLKDIVMQPVLLEGDDGEERKATRIVLITENGEAWGTTSTGVFTALHNLIGIVGEPTYEPAIQMVAKKQQGRNGYKFTTLEAVFD